MRRGTEAALILAALALAGHALAIERFRRAFLGTFDELVEHSTDSSYSPGGLVSALAQVKWARRARRNRA